jgi:3-dehydroquinate synthase
VKTLNVELAERRYPVMVGRNLLPDAGVILARRGFKSAPVVITNRKVFKLHGDLFMKSLRRTFGEVPVIFIGDGERYKNHATLFSIYDGMFRANADRRSWIVAFGGGVVGDIAGYAAATFMRGIPFVMAPTTLLAQVDSSIGGKVAINVAQGKNLIGAFHQPAAVLSDTDMLSTLPARELASGLYEVVKCAAIGSESLLNYVERRLDEILSCRPQALAHIVLEAARIKADVVARDEKESSLRMILNYGHTVGHALETATSYGIFKHGEAVAWGMIAAIGFGRELGLLRSDEAARLAAIIRQISRLPSIEGISINRLWNALGRDKKFQSGGIRMIFIPRLGEAQILPSIDPASLRQFLKKFLQVKGDLSLK